MKVVLSWFETAALIFILNVCFNESYQLTGLQVCSLCGGTVQNTSDVGQFCSSSAGRIDRRCCLANNNTIDPERIIGLDLSNCSLTQVKELPGASKVFMIDLSLNPIVNISEKVFLGFLGLNYMILPQDVVCPGGNVSWQKVKVKQGKRLCKGQNNMCNQTGQMSMSCPEHSLCGPYGPGFFECSCAENYQGYKCLRQGEFPVVEVFGPLAASTVVISFLVWVTQRRKAKSL
ncbi:all-trans retinoic acid-induced differentiation factor [Girardinichthys multiradiatus]|uniref:all-trans retinoic acid-induced differentiation factor n=1 Tax=Girardinichthys multiradiatus TaxID=208333 RepID=UPI001FAC6C88|nr:all-trans retinoic acid-induced differentiation factor [Girardinichthys multiradiatus]